MYKEREREMYLSQMDFAVTHCISEAAVSWLYLIKRSINIKPGKKWHLFSSRLPRYGILTCMQLWFVRLIALVCNLTRRVYNMRNIIDIFFPHKIIAINKYINEKTHFKYVHKCLDVMFKYLLLVIINSCF